jgi:hypothetical protein
VNFYLHVSYFLTDLGEIRYRQCPRFSVDKSRFVWNSVQRKLRFTCGRQWVFVFLSVLSVNQYCLSVCLSVLSVCLSVSTVCLSVCLPACTVCLSVLTVLLVLSVCLSVLSVCLSVNQYCLSVGLSVCMYCLYVLSVCQYCLSVCLSVCPHYCGHILCCRCAHSTAVYLRTLWAHSCSGCNDVTATRVPCKCGREIVKAKKCHTEVHVARHGAHVNHLLLH